MARIIENMRGRRMVEVSTDDVLNIVREFQNIIAKKLSYSELRRELDSRVFCLPEDI